MLLESEVKSGEIYVNDKDFVLSHEEKPQLFQMVQEPREVRRSGLYGGTEIDKTNPVWENITTGELVGWGTHCFTTIERMKKQFFNIKSISDKRRVDYVKEAYEVICNYEKTVSES